MTIGKLPWALPKNTVRSAQIDDAEGEPVVYDEGAPSREEAEHIIRAVNGLHAAGITPAALVADPQCVAKLVAAAKLHTRYEERTKMISDVTPAGYAECCADDLGVRDVVVALRACGIEVKL